jgi:hypothetical protein
VDELLRRFGHDRAKVLEAIYPNGCCKYGGPHSPYRFRSCDSEWNELEGRILAEEIKAAMAQIPTTEEAVAREEERQAAEEDAGRGVELPESLLDPSAVFERVIRERDPDLEYACPSKWVRNR